MEKKYIKPIVHVVSVTTCNIMNSSPSPQVGLDTNPDEKLDAEDFGSKSRRGDSDGWSGGLW